MRKQLLLFVITSMVFALSLSASVFNVSLTENISSRKCNAKETEICPPFRIQTIVIDPGHGGKDPGCSGEHSREKHIALAIAQSLRDKIEAQYPAINVILTRDTDVFIPLHERASIANRNDADLFISIHCNYMPGSGATKGSETYVMGLHTADHNLDVAKRENEAILLEDNYETHYDYDPNSPEGHILLSLYQNLHLEQSIMFAEKVEFHFHATANRKSRGVKQAGFVVLKETAMPSVLIETGFLSSASEEAFLLSDEGKNLASLAILNAFIEYKNTLEGVDETQTQIAVTEYSEQPQPAIVANRIPEPAPQQQQQYTLLPPPVASTSLSSRPVQENQQIYRSSEVQDWERELAFGEEDPSEEVAAPAPQMTVKSPVVQPERTIVPQGGQSVLSTSVPTTGQDRAAQPRKVQGLVFAVQLAASPSPINTDLPVWQQVDYLIEIVEEDQLYKYRVQRMPSLDDAFAARLILQNKGFQDAFIVAYHRGQRISMAQAQALLDGN